MEIEMKFKSCSLQKEFTNMEMGKLEFLRTRTYVNPEFYNTWPGASAKSPIWMLGASFVPFQKACKWRWMGREQPNSNQYPYGMLAMQGTSLFTMPKFWYIMYNFIHYFNYFKYDMLRFEYFMGIHKCLHIYICIYVYTSVYIYMLYVIGQLNHLDPFIENVRNSLIL